MLYIYNTLLKKREAALFSLLIGNNVASTLILIRGTVRKNWLRQSLYENRAAEIDIKSRSGWRPLSVKLLSPKFISELFL